MWMVKKLMLLISNDFFIYVGGATPNNKEELPQECSAFFFLMSKSVVAQIVKKSYPRSSAFLFLNIKKFGTPNSYQELSRSFAWLALSQSQKVGSGTTSFSKTSLKVGASFKRTCQKQLAFLIMLLINTYISCFHVWNAFLIIPFLVTGTGLLWVSFESGRKQTFTWAICSKICCIACMINHAGKLIYLCACLHKQDCAGLLDKPEYGY